MDKRINIIFYGAVQGVGFRFTARDLAQKHHIKGWVKNLSSGKVELEAQASIEQLDIFLKELKDLFASNITEEKAQEIKLSSDKDFQILF